MLRQRATRLRHCLVSQRSRRGSTLATCWRALGSTFTTCVSRRRYLVAVFASRSGWDAAFRRAWMACTCAVHGPRARNVFADCVSRAAGTPLLRHASFSQLLPPARQVYSEAIAVDPTSAPLVLWCVGLAVAVKRVLRRLPTHRTEGDWPILKPRARFYSTVLSAVLVNALARHSHADACCRGSHSFPPIFCRFNGGPGCSSMEGAFSESGPYHVTQFSNPPTLEVNPWSWNNETNNLCVSSSVCALPRARSSLPPPLHTYRVVTLRFIESPAGVGFSYCDTPSGCDHTDTSTAANNLLALLNFFTLFPELANRPTFITGESYVRHPRATPCVLDARFLHRPPPPPP